MTPSSRSPWVVKIGGLLGEEPALRAELAAACAGAGAPVVVVHGGGAAISRLQESLGRSPAFADGRRVTDPADLALVEMVLSGSLNKALVRALRAAGAPAVGLSGCDGDLLECGLLPGLGRVGRPERVRPAVIEALLDAGWTPVVSPVSLGPDGEAVNVNADEAACALAAALGAERLWLLSDVEGVRVGGIAAEAIDAERIEELIAAGEISGGMVPKTRSAAVALATGVGSVVIGGFAGGRLNDVTGTTIVATSADRGRAFGRPIGAPGPGPIDWAALVARLKPPIPKGAADVA